MMEHWELMNVTVFQSRKAIWISIASMIAIVGVDLHAKSLQSPRIPSILSHTNMGQITIIETIDTCT